MWKAPALSLLPLLLVALSNPPLFARGLEQLSDKSPEGEAAKAALDETPDQSKKDADKKTGDDDDDDDDKDDKDKVKDEKPQPPSDTSKAMAQKLSLATSFGWVHVVEKGGKWKSDGMSDFSIGYVFATFSDAFNLAGTYRYAPIEVNGTKNAHMYRGVWETHYLGARATYHLAPAVSLVGSGEVGLLLSHLDPEDGLPPQSSAAKNGGMVALGGGADYGFFDKGVVTLGPRLYFAAGVANTIQFAINAGFVF